MDPSNDSEEASISSSGSSAEVDAFSCGSELESRNEHEIKFEQHDELPAKRESRAILKLRLLVILVILLAAAAVSTVAYLITSNGEQQEFDTQYTGAALKVIEAFEGIIKNKLGGISALAVTIEAYGMDYRNDWPFVTVSSFQERSAPVRSHSGALFLKVCPLVTDDNRDAWENYTLNDEDGWIKEGLAYQRERATTLFENVGLLDLLPHNATEVIDNGTIRVMINAEGDIVPETERGPYLPIWQTSPLVRDEVNVNVLRKYGVSEGAIKCLQTKSALVGQLFQAPAGGILAPSIMTRFFATLLSLDANEPVEYQGDPMSRVYLPIFNSFHEPRELVAVMIAQVHWASYFTQILPSSIQGITAVIGNPCDGYHTFIINGEAVQYLGFGDMHDTKFSLLEKSATFAAFDTIEDGTEKGLPLYHDECSHSIRVYPTQTFSDHYITNTPLIVTISVAAIFLFTVSMFLVYDRLVERRQRLVMSSAAKSSAIVASLFPKNVRERLMQEQQPRTSTGNGELMPPKSRIKSLLDGDGIAAEQSLDQKPIADLFPDATVLFADIAGFTAWSSTREPAHVFVLLQTVYQVFDIIAKRRGVFKVETIGDSYVAVTGCPEPQANHAIIMAKFAADCMEKMNTITQELEVTLGPGTGDLAMRFGLHSGPVTAGVLRGERSRFQLFGDTVNTAARMESTGMKKKIQASQATADLLIAAGKGHWVTPRTDAVEAKGKGVLKTFWISPTAKRGHSRSSSETNSATQENHTENSVSERRFAPTEKSAAEIAKHDRLIDWITELLKDYIKPILERRYEADLKPTSDITQQAGLKSHGIALDEVVEVVCLPDFDHTAQDVAQDVQGPEVTVSDQISVQLRRYVAIVASMYRDNPFHNFEHACHVTMSVHKFIQRILTPDLRTVEGSKRNSKAIELQLHDYTHGMRSDRLTLFAIVFSALIHDIDHRGISNSQLMVEEKQMAQMYRNTSIAEQNSLTLAWNLLMSEGFEALRSALFATESDLKRFRQVFVNVVLATDIFDKELNDMRKARWYCAFGGQKEMATNDQNSLKATIVMEHIMQASDVSHTMQHWHIYRKWNSRLFHEMTRAHQEGRMDKDPATFWYEGELDFFDNYVIPLAKKLKECNVLGVSSDECLAYARKNRAEWEEYGQGIVDAMKLNFAELI